MTSVLLRRSFGVAVLAAALFAPALRSSAVDQAPSAPAPATATTAVPAEPDHRSVRVVDALNLQDKALHDQVLGLLVARASGLRVWHAKHDAELKKLWNAFNKAHGKRDEPGTVAVEAQITALYAEIRPAHDEFLAKIGALLTPAQVELVEDKIMEDKLPQDRSKFAATYRNYQQIFPGLTEEQKVFIAGKLRAARDEALDCETQLEKSSFFKKYKIQIEAYLTAQGYDVKKSYVDFVAKMNAAPTAKKSKKGADVAPAEDAPSTKPQ